MKTTKYYFLALMLGYVVSSTNAQEQHEHPDHPKGNSATIYKALPLYNEACELYEKGGVSAAKNSLYEAIATSFALTEAHLFLGEIYYEENVKDSALYFLKSGIDFAIEQKPHFFFHLFELSLELGQYDILKQNVKYFKKNYINDGVDAPYEDGYPFDRSDLEYYEACIALIYDYKSWVPKLNNVTQLPEDVTQVSRVGNKFYALKFNTVFVSKKEDGKFRKLKGLNHSVESFCVSSDQKKVILSLKESDSSYLCRAKLQGNTILEIQRYSELNKGNWQGTPFLTADKKSLYFASNMNGNKDIFVASLDDELITSGSIQALSRINTSGDEEGLFIDEANKEIYFSSTGHPGFGGSDVFICRDFEVENGAWLPINPRNFGASINSHENEVSIFQIGNEICYSRASKNELKWFKANWNRVKEFNYEISAPKLQDTSN